MFISQTKLCEASWNGIKINSVKIATTKKDLYKTWISYVATNNNKMMMMMMMMKLLLLVIIAIGTDDQGLPAHYFFLASIFKTNSLCLYPMAILDSKMLFCYFGTHMKILHWRMHFYSSLQNNTSHYFHNHKKKNIEKQYQWKSWFGMIKKLRWWKRRISSQEFDHVRTEW